MRLLPVLIALVLAAGCSPEPPPPPAAKAAAPQPKPEPPPESAWVAESRRQFERLVTGAPAGGTLVLPFQSPRPAADVAAGDADPVHLSSRMVMAHLVAQRIAAAGATVPDPTVVAIALGEGREFAPGEIARLARLAKATRVVLGTATWRGSFRDGRMHRTLDISVRVMTLAADGDQQAATPRPSGEPLRLASLPISDEEPPELAFAKRLEDVARHLGLAAKGQADASPAPADFPARPLDAAEKPAPNIAERLWHIQLVAGLYPADERRGRLRTSERLLAVAEGLQAGHPDRALLRARALANLERRPAAVAALREGGTTPEEQAFAAFLDGDMRRMQEAVPTIRRPLPRLLAEVDLYTLRVYYDSLQRDDRPAEIERIARLVPAGWQPLVVWYLLERDSWNVRPAFEVKLALDAELPVPGQDAQEILRGRLAVGDQAAAEALAEELPFAHVQALLEQRKADLCCVRAASTPALLDYVLLFRDEAVARSTRRVELTGFNQGLPEQALQLVDQLERTALKGHPALASRRVQLLDQLIQAAGNPAERQRLTAERVQAARLVAAYMPWQGWDTSVAVSRGDVAAPGPLRAYHHALAMEFPPAPPWIWQAAAFVMTIPASKPTAKAGATPDSAAVAEERRQAIVVAHGRQDCEYAVFDVGPCTRLHESLQRFRRAHDAAALEKEIAARFIGSAQRTTALVRYHRSRDDSAAAQSVLAEAMRLAPNQFDAYKASALLALERDDAKAAARIALSYPRFAQERRAFTVGDSNDAYGIGYLLALRGAALEAKPLLGIAAENRDGSGASMLGQYRVAIIEGRFDDAVQWLSIAARRYRQPGTMRQYASFLFARGEPELAWGVFGDERRRTRLFDPWRSAGVGLKMAGADGEALARWMGELEKSGADAGARSHYLPGVVFQVAMLDRSLASADEALTLLYERIFRLPPEQAKARIAQTDRVRSIHESLFDGYRASRNRDFEKLLAVGDPPPPKFQTVMLELPIHWSHGSEALLPYFAIAAAKAGKVERARETYDRNNPKLQTYADHFDVHLAEAVFAALAGDHATAERRLVAARANLPDTRDRFLTPEYEFAEICELLAEETGRAEYAQIGLDWARRFQLFEPWAAWAYAYEAKHSKPGRERTRALALALHLDPRSERIAAIDEKSKAAARAWLKANNPFKPRPADARPMPRQST